MSSLFGDKPKNILGRKLSSRYLSSDAFTSFRNKLGRKKVRRLGSAYSGRRSLFEMKYSFMRIIIAILLLCILIYSVPTFRYGIHRLLVKQTVITTEIDGSIEDVLGRDEFYVAPKYLTTDKFIGKPDIRVEDYVLEPGDVIADAFTEAPIGMLESVDNTVVVRLFSDPGFKNNFYIKGAPLPQVPTENIEGEVATTSTTTDVILTVQREALQPILFEGSGYGEMVAKLPPQKKDIKVGDSVYMQTTDGPKAVAQISRVSMDTSSGSTFTIVYVQLLVSPQSLYKVKVLKD